MTDTTVASALAYYSAHGAALFPIPAGQKAPFGIVASFKHDHSSDPVQWAAWQAANPGCNFGVVAFASNWIIVDVDTSGDAGREEAWALWCELCTSWGIAALQPHVQSARGGWHIYFQVPPHIDASTLRQPDAIKKRINVRCVGFTVAAGSTFVENGIALPYLMLTDAAPYPAPDALVEHCTRAPTPTASLARIGTHDKGDVAAFLKWLNDRDAFAAYEDWLAAGMALKLEYGDDGLELWELTFNDTVTPDVVTSKWNSFATEPQPGVQTLNSLFDRAHKMGWKGSIRKSTASMFDGVAQIAAAAGAQLHSAGPLPPPPQPQGGIPMMAGQEELARLGTPILEEFIDASTDAPARPMQSDYPSLPESMNGHGLYVPMQTSLAKVMAMAEIKPFRVARVLDVLSVLNVLHSDVYDAVCRRLRAMGHALPERKIKLAAENLREKVERITVTQDKWEYDRHGEPQSDNSDNVAVLLGVLGLELRWNGWLDRMEVRGGIDADLRWPEWSYVDDAIVAKLRTRANRTKTRFRPGKEFLWESLLALAHANTTDPALDMLATLQNEWDGVPRLAIWLTAAAHVPCDPYHMAVSRNIIGGMVRRVRQPGCKHDTVPVFFGPQGTGKSTMAGVIADMGKSTLSEILRRSTDWFADEIMLGDESKELVLSLAGKCLVEIGEMGMRGSANTSHVKAMLSRQVDRGRTAYARAVTERPRRNVFFGTVNDDEPLTDPTGNRRFLPVRVDKECNLTWLSENIRQIIGEAATLEARGQDFTLPREVWAFAAEHQEAARSATDMEIMLNDWFAETPQHGDVSFITATDLVQLSKFEGWRNGGSGAARSAIMKRLGFRQESAYLHNRKTRMWVRGECSPKEVQNRGVRYMVGQDSSGRTIVNMRSDRAAGATAVPLPPPPQPTRAVP